MLYEVITEQMLPPTIDVDRPWIDTTFPDYGYEDVGVYLPDYGYFSVNAANAVSNLAPSKATSLMPEKTAMVRAQASLAKTVYGKTYRFETFYHPYVSEFVKYLNRDGIDGLLQRPVQFLGSLFEFEYEDELPADSNFFV